MVLTVTNDASILPTLARLSGVAPTPAFILWGRLAGASSARAFFVRMQVKEQVEQVARVCHEANRAYCESIGDRSQPSWDQAPEWQRKSAIKGVEFHIAHVSAGHKPSPSTSHESWLAEKYRDGWKYGPVKDPVKKEHPCFLPYEQLPVEQRLKDYIFAAIVEAFWKGRTFEMATTA